MNTEKYTLTGLRKEIHKKLKIQSAKAGMTMNDYLSKLLEGSND